MCTMTIKISSDAKLQFNKMVLSKNAHLRIEVDIKRRLLRILRLHHSRFVGEGNGQDRWNQRESITQRNVWQVNEKNRTGENEKSHGRSISIIMEMLLANVQILEQGPSTKEPREDFSAGYFYHLFGLFSMDHINPSHLRSPSRRGQANSPSLCSPPLRGGRSRTRIVAQSILKHLPLELTVL